MPKLLYKLSRSTNDPNQIYPSEIWFSSEPNAKHKINYMHTEYMQSRLLP